MVASAKKLIPARARPYGHSRDGHSAVASVGEKAHEARQGLSDALTDAKQTCRELEEKAVITARNTDKLIHTHPYRAIGVAVAIGLVVGLLAARK